MNTHIKTEGNRDHDAQEMFPAMDATHFQIFLRTNFPMISFLIDKLRAFKQSNFSAMYLNSNVIHALQLQDSHNVQMLFSPL